jgi:membrane protease YdiL (CAAX protease family)
MNGQFPSAKFSLVLKSQFFVVALALLLLPLINTLPETKINTLQAIAVGVTLAAITFLFFWLLYKYGGRFMQTLKGDIRRIVSLFTGYSLWQCACIAVLAGVGEELLFRGVVQVWLTQHFSIAVAIAISSLIFGLLHYLSFTYFICATLMSIAFGIGYYLSGSLLMVTLWHGVYDFIALMAIVKYPHVLDMHSVKPAEERT